MKIILEEDKKLILYLPINILKWKLVCKMLTEKTEFNFDYKHMKDFIKVIKKYIKKNGHFTLIEVNSKEGNIKIVV